MLGEQQCWMDTVPVAMHTMHPSHPPSCLSHKCMHFHTCTHSQQYPFTPTRTYLADPCELLLELLHQQPLIPHVQAAVAHSFLEQVGQRLATKVEPLHTWCGQQG